MNQPLAPQHIFRFALPLITFALTVNGVWADPGKAFQSVRAKLVAQYDANGDGRLDLSERETMRQAAKQAGRSSEGRRRGRRWEPPREWVERYDRNGDGELDQSEQGAAFAGEQDRLRKRYDKDGNGSLSEAEKKALEKDYNRGAFDGMERFIAMQVGGFSRRGRGWGRERGGDSSDWLRFDKDGDGIASEEELKALRSSRR